MNAHVLKQIEKIAISSDITVEWFDKPIKTKEPQVGDVIRLDYTPDTNPNNHKYLEYEKESRFSPAKFRKVENVFVPETCLYIVLQSYMNGKVDYNWRDDFPGWYVQVIKLDGDSGDMDNIRYNRKGKKLSFHMTNGFADYIPEVEVYGIATNTEVPAFRTWISE